MLNFFSCKNAGPDHTAVLAAIERDSISTQNGISLSPDYRHLLVSMPIDEKNAGGRSLVRIFERSWRGNHYSRPRPVSFNSEYNDYHPVLSPDGQRVYFNSTRPKPGKEQAQATVDIWYAEREGRQWSEPRYLEQINTEYHESYPAIDEMGNLYFNSDRPGGQGSMDIWMAERQGEVFLAPQILTSLNSADSENDLTVSGDGKTLIFNRYIFADGSIDLYFSRKEGANWSRPRLLQALNEPATWELTPTFGPQGKLFLYEREGVIRAWFLEDLRLDL